MLINIYIKYLTSLYKKIYILKEYNSIEYLNNNIKCDIYINEIYPKIKLIINNLKKNIGNIKEQENYLISTAKIYSFDNWYIKYYNSNNNKKQYIKQNK